MELTVKRDGEVTLSEDVSKQIIMMEKVIKEVKEKEDLLKKKIMDEMEEKGIIKFDNEYISVKYIASTDRETFDKKRFQKENPELYDEYIDIKPVKASIRIKVK